jgi:hypothetical protein
MITWGKLSSLVLSIPSLSMSLSTANAHTDPMLPDLTTIAMRTGLALSPHRGRTTTYRPNNAAHKCVTARPNPTSPDLQHVWMGWNRLGWTSCWQPVSCSQPSSKPATIAGNQPVSNSNARGKSRCHHFQVLAPNPINIHMKLIT